MIVDSMTKLEVMKSLRKDFDTEAKPYFDKKWKMVVSALRTEVMRKKQTVRREYEFVTSTNVKFYCLFVAKSIKTDPSHEFVVEFDWNKRHCYASFYEEGGITILQGHCLDRYLERVLKKNIPKRELFYKHLLSSQESAFEIVLPTPTHEFSKYYGFADALFLGDFDPGIINSGIIGGWYNTCISLKEAGPTQSKLLNTLQSLQSFVKRLSYNPISNKGLSATHKRACAEDMKLREDLIDFYKKSYMLLLLHEKCNFWFTKLEDEFADYKSFLEEELTSLGIEPFLLSPYSVTDGIALEGELDYNGKKE